MVSKQVKFPQQGELKLGDEFEDDFEAIANQKAITEAGKLLKTIGNQLKESTEARQELEKKENPNCDREGGRESSPLSRFVTVVDTILEWLENSGKSMISNFKKQETILRGFFHMTGTVRHIYAQPPKYQHFENKMNLPYNMLSCFMLYSLLKRFEEICGDFFTTAISPILINVIIHKGRAHFRTLSRDRKILLTPLLMW